MNSILKWVGGKRLLRKEIARYIPEDIQAYIEPFGGAAWVMLLKGRWAKAEVYNDLDNRLVNLFLQVKFHPEELIRELTLMPSSRQLFELLLQQEGLTEIQRAARFLWVITRSFGGKGEAFGTSAQQGPASMENRLELVRKLSKRFDRVTIENLHYADLLARYDRPGSFFYLDPPYTQGFTYANSKGFDHQELRNHLENLQGRWLLSYNDSLQVRELYKGYNIVVLERPCGLDNRVKYERYRELLIINH